MCGAPLALAHCLSACSPKEKGTDASLHPRPSVSFRDGTFPSHSKTYFKAFDCCAELSLFGFILFRLGLLGLGLRLLRLRLGGNLSGSCLFLQRGAEDVAERSASIG